MTFEEFKTLVLTKYSTATDKNLQDSFNKANGDKLLITYTQYKLALGYVNFGVTDFNNNNHLDFDEYKEYVKDIT